MSRLSHSAGLSLALLLTACARGAASTGTAPAATPSATPSSVMAATPPADTIVPRSDSVLVRFTTTRGEFDVVVRSAWAPHGAARVHALVQSRHFDGARFFRAIPGFVIQWGLPADTARNATWRGRSIPDDTVRATNRRGTISFAAGGPNTRTSQLFINLRDNARLDALGFAPVGEVVRGLDVVDALYTGYGAANNTPDQRRLTSEGEAYLAKEYPLLDRIISVRVMTRWGPQ